MPMHVFIRQAVIVALWFVADAEPVWCADDPTVVNDATINRLIGDLSDKDFKVRDNAVRHLIGIEDARPALRRALKSEDAEVARLAGLILDKVERAAIARERERLRRDIKAGEASRVIERFARWRERETDAASWQSMIDFAWKTTSGAIRLYAARDEDWVSSQAPLTRVKEMPPDKVIAWASDCLTIRASTTGLWRADGLVLVGGAQGAFVSSNRFVSDKTTIGRSIVLANGPVTCGSVVINTILICDGEVDIKRAIIDSVVIARGAIACPNIVRNSVIVSTSTIDAGAAKRGPHARTCVFKEHEASPAGFVRWFTPADVGLEVAPAKDAVKVEKLHDGKLPAKAGLKVGDLITAVDRGKIDSAEAFRKLLRRGSVQDRCVLTVRRGDQTLDVTLDFRAEERAAEKKKDR